MSSATDIQLFRGRLSDKECATTPKGIVGGFEFTVFQRDFKKMTGHMSASGKGNQQTRTLYCSYPI